ncbi:unnamed protein product [Gongylonema pulchrum]|uniref:Cold and drought-regulated protein CORA-like n=1 Tax=Gongylonema pulchrum TaxID=637853 RepID=A0A183D0T9_9BILA|nr:unnamed protein product [Gongylonema pulchrum]
MMDEEMRRFPPHREREPHHYENGMGEPHIGGGGGRDADDYGGGGGVGIGGHGEGQKHQGDDFDNYQPGHDHGDFRGGDEFRGDDYRGGDEYHGDDFRGAYRGRGGFRGASGGGVSPYGGYGPQNMGWRARGPGNWRGGRGAFGGPPRAPYGSGDVDDAHGFDRPRGEHGLTTISKGVLSSLI